MELSLNSIGTLDDYGLAFVRHAGVSRARGTMGTHLGAYRPYVPSGSVSLTVELNPEGRGLRTPCPPKGLDALYLACHSLVVKAPYTFNALKNSSNTKAMDRKQFMLIGITHSTDATEPIKKRNSLR